MRSVLFLFVFLLSGASAYADSSCLPVSNGFRSLTEAPKFTILETRTGQHEIILQGRPDGIYEPTNEKSSFKKKWERDEFSTRTIKRIEQTLSDDFKCQLASEETINGKIMLTYDFTERVSHESRIWIGKDDGLIYQISENNRKIFTLVYGPQK